MDINSKFRINLSFDKDNFKILKLESYLRLKGNDFRFILEEGRFSIENRKFGIELRMKFEMEFESGTLE